MRSGKATFCATVLCGQIAYDWNTMPQRRLLVGTLRFGEDEKTTLSPMLIVPSVGVSRPTTQRIVLVFPQPDGPRRTSISPS